MYIYLYVYSYNYFLCKSLLCIQNDAYYFIFIVLYSFVGTRTLCKYKQLLSNLREFYTA